jgi:hypothetical protein
MIVEMGMSASGLTREPGVVEPRLPKEVLAAMNPQVEEAQGGPKKAVQGAMPVRVELAVDNRAAREASLAQVELVAAERAEAVASRVEAVAAERAELVAAERAELVALDRAELVAADRAEAGALDRAELVAADRAELVAADRAEAGALDRAELVAADWVEPVELPRSTVEHQKNVPLLLWDSLPPYSPNAILVCKNTVRTHALHAQKTLTARHSFNACSSAQTISAKKTAGKTMKTDRTMPKPWQEKMVAWTRTAIASVLIRRIRVGAVSRPSKAIPPLMPTGLPSRLSLP